MTPIEIRQLKELNQSKLFLISAINQLAKHNQTFDLSTSFHSYLTVDTQPIFSYAGATGLDALKEKAITDFEKMGESITDFILETLKKTQL
jgi:hypothetical protein